MPMLCCAWARASTFDQQKRQAVGLRHRRSGAARLQRLILPPAARRVVLWPADKELYAAHTLYCAEWSHCLSLRVWLMEQLPFKTCFELRAREFESGQTRDQVVISNLKKDADAYRNPYQACSG